MNRKDKALKRIGEIVAAHLDVRDMCAGDAAKLLGQIVATRAEMLELAGHLDTLGSGKLAGDIRRQERAGVFSVPGRKADGSDTQWFDEVTRKRVPAPRLRRGRA